MGNQSAKKSDQKASSTGDLGKAELQARADKEAEQGYHGEVADPTPNHAYTVAGVVSGEPTPETDKDAAAAAAEHSADVASAPEAD